MGSTCVYVDQKSKTFYYLDAEMAVDWRSAVIYINDLSLYFIYQCQPNDYDQKIPKVPYINNNSLWDTNHALLFGIRSLSAGQVPHWFPLTEVSSLLRCFLFYK
jgi:hypothetical protein